MSARESNGVIGGKNRALLGAIRGRNESKTVRANLRTVERVTRIVRDLGMVNSASRETRRQSSMDVPVEVCGNLARPGRMVCGRHGRLPVGIPADVEMVLEVSDSL